MGGTRDWFKVTLLFPLQDNEGNPFPEEVWRWWSDEMTKLVGAFTDRGVVRGWWGKRSELNREVFMVVKTQREVDALRAFLRRARQKFKQDVMYFEYHPVHFEEVE